MSSATSNPDAALRADLAGLSELIGHHLDRLRERGRSPLSEAVGGMLVEEGEAEQIITELLGGMKFGSPTTSFAPGSRVLREFMALYQLEVMDANILLLAMAGEVDSRFGRLFAFLNDHAGRVMPTVGLAAAILGSEEEPSAVLHRLVGNAPLLRYRLVTLEGEEGHANQILRVDSCVWQRVLGLAESCFAIEQAPETDTLGELLVSEETRKQARKLAAWVFDTRGATVVVGGQEGSGRDALAKAIAQQCGTSIVCVDSTALTSRAAWRSLERETIFHGAAVVRHRGEAKLSIPTEFTAPLIISAVPEVYSSLASSRTIATIETKPFTTERRLDLWQELLDRECCDDSVDLELLSARFRFGPQLIESAVRTARAGTSVQGSAKLSHDRLEEVCRRLPQADLGGLANRLECPFAREDLILRPNTQRELDLALTWAVHGHRLFSDQGPGAKLRVGVGLACLFTGPPGTGKTMAARILGQQMGLDVYRVDLSRVVSKYIGETEKNLSALFTSAAAANAILFFDEADALFGRRTEVKDAHDRYANVETGFLLQRMEDHPGMSILATNLRKNLDDAFLRRIHIVAEFQKPEVAERMAIWSRLLPEEAHERLDIDQISETFEVAGGDIRNAVMAALLFAAQADEPLGMKHVVLGLYRELQKAGRMVDPEEFGEWRPHVIEWSRLGV